VRKLPKRLQGELRGKPPTKSSYFDAVLREKQKKAKKFGKASGIK